jgi:hypothetical protein
MRRAVISLLVIWFVVAGLSPWAQADRPGWVPQEFKRGGGDELESCGRLDPTGDGSDMGCMPTAPELGLEMGFGSHSRHDLPVEPFNMVDLAWLMLFHFLWNW